MKGIARAQHYRHQTEEPKLCVSLAPPNHQDTNGNDRRQIDGVKQCFYDCLHRI